MEKGSRSFQLQGSLSSGNLRLPSRLLCRQQGLKMMGGIGTLLSQAGAGDTSRGPAAAIPLVSAGIKQGGTHFPAKGTKCQ